MRTAVRQMMLRPKEVSYYLPMQDNTAKLAISHLHNYISSDGTPNCLQDWVAKWILECEFLQVINV